MISLISAPAPDGPGFPRHAPSNASRYLLSAEIVGAPDSSSSAAFSAAFSANPAFVDIALRAGGGLVGPRRALELGRARGGIGLVAGERRRALSLGRGSPPGSPPRCAVTHASASASVPKDLCTAPLMPVTCALASSHVLYTPGSRPRATP